MTVSLLIQAAEATGGFYVFKVKLSIDKKIYMSCLPQKPRNWLKNMELFTFHINFSKQNILLFGSNLDKSETTDQNL